MCYNGVFFFHYSLATRLRWPIESNLSHCYFMHMLGYRDYWSLTITKCVLVHSFIHSNLHLITYFMKTVQTLLLKEITNKQSYLMRQRKINKKSMEASRGVCWDAWGQTINGDKNERTDNKNKDRHDEDNNDENNN